MEEKNIIFNCFDNPSKTDYKFEIDEELCGIQSKWPKEKVIVRNQKDIPACTFYSQYHTINGYNVLEDERNGISRSQIDPIEPRNRFCKARGYYDRGYNIQGAATEAKKEGMIVGWSTISNDISKNEQIEKMKKALDMGFFMNTGSANGDRSTIKKTGIYTIRKDNAFVGHAWSIVDYNETKKCFIAINSRGIRGKEKGYFYVPYDLVDKIYSKLVIVDKDDSGYFAKLKERSQAMEGVRQLKKIYELTIPQIDKDLCAKLATELRTIYGFTDKDL